MTRSGGRPGHARSAIRGSYTGCWSSSRRRDGRGRRGFRGIDEKGREVLSYIDGHTPQAPSDACLARAAALTREFHDLTAGTELAADQEVVCHNDLSPRNTICGGDGRPVAFIDWDLAAPGPRIHDVAHLCWQFTDIGADDAAAAGRGMQVICDEYGLADRSALIPAVLWWQDRCWRGIQAAAEAGDPAMTRLRDRGAVREVRDAYNWVARHRHSLEHAVGRSG